MEWEEFQSALNLDKDAINTQAKESAKSKLCAYSIAEKEGLKLTKKQYKERLDEILKDAGMTKEQFESQYGMTIDEYADQNGFFDSIQIEKVQDFIYENATAEEKKDEAKDDANAEAKDDADAEAKDEAADETKDESADDAEAEGEAND